MGQPGGTGQPTLEQQRTDAATKVEENCVFLMSAIDALLALESNTRKREQLFSVRKGIRHFHGDLFGMYPQTALVPNSDVE